MEQHNKIINNAAKRILASEGLFRKGASRTWIEDNGYYLTIVEFQPSGFDKGTYLNVGTDFLWERTAELNKTLIFSYGGRVSVNGAQFAGYRKGDGSSDELFEEKAEKFACAALDKVKEYRKFRDPESAKEILVQGIRLKSRKNLFWELYDIAMLCFFKGDFKAGKKYFDEYLNILKSESKHFEWEKSFYEHCLKEIVPQTETPEKAQKTVYGMINRRRAFFNNIQAYKKMKKDIIFQDGSR